MESRSGGAWSLTAPLLDKSPLFKLLRVGTLCMAALFSGLASVEAATPPEATAIRMLTDYDLSPSGDTLVFSWHGDVWIVPTTGGVAQPITRDSSDDRTPCFSPDGQELAFTSNRTGSYQIYTVPLEGGVPTRHTQHSEGYSIIEYYPDGKHFLASVQRDHFFRDGARYAKVDRTPETPDPILFDAAATSGRLTTDGSALLFMREGVRWWRKGYYGPQQGQIWHWSSESKSFSELVRTPGGARWPLPHPNGEAYHFVAQTGGSFELYRARYDGTDVQALTISQSGDDDGVLFPVLSRDGSRFVFRRGFDLYTFQNDDGAEPITLEILYAGDPIADDQLRSELRSATDVVFSPDGLEIAFAAGGDIWVMDTELKEPVRVTSTATEDREPRFSADGDAIFFIADQARGCDIAKVTRADIDLYWWQSNAFKMEWITRDEDTETRMEITPNGNVAFLKNEDLFVHDAESGETRRLVECWNAPSYAFAPDGRWFAYSTSDDDYNRDVWLAPTDQSRRPFNLSTHPDSDYSPTWSPDGKVLAWVGRRDGEERDIYYVFLDEQDDDEDSRDRTLEKAIEKMAKARKKKNAKKSEPAKNGEPERKEAEKTEDAKTNAADESAKTELDEPKKDADEPATVVDLDGIRDRIRRIRIPDSSERGLVWTGDSRLEFSATVRGDRGVYRVTFPDELEPKRVAASGISGARYLKKAKKLGGHVSGVPATFDSKGKIERFSFEVIHETSRSEKYAAAFDQAWRAMRDEFYDERFGNRNWDQIHTKYASAARSATSIRELQQVVSLMLGELNASHLGFSARGAIRRGPDLPWRVVTAHLGLRFDPEHRGPGWKVRDVLPNGPTDEEETRVRAGEVVLSVDGTPVDPSVAVESVLNGPTLDRDIELVVRDVAGESRTFQVRPISYGAARSRLYEHWVRQNRVVVDDLSSDRFGYLHIRGMNWSSFRRFEEELFEIGAGKDGLVIDVRKNGGGFTTDHLLTVLTQPEHAVTRSRGSGLGYPQDRRVYATWSKPIVVLCDQDSFSNAEIFSHAIKSLERGQLVGVQTAGGVISTGSRTIFDLGRVRMPTRGWYVIGNGVDMELAGAIPDHVLWPLPGELPAGFDRQLEKAIRVLDEDVEKWQARPKPRIRTAAERRAREGRAKSDALPETKTLDADRL